MNLSNNYKTFLTTLALIACIFVIMLAVFYSLNFKQNNSSVIIGKFIGYSGLPLADIRIEDRFGYIEQIYLGTFDKSKIKTGDILQIDYDAIDKGVYQSKKVYDRGKQGSMVEPITNKCFAYDEEMIGQDKLQIRGEVSYVNQIQANVRTPKDHAIYLRTVNNFKHMNFNYGDCLDIVYESARIVSVSYQTTDEKSANSISRNFPEWYYLLFSQDNSFQQYSSNSGGCIIRDTDSPIRSARPLGNGYAKMIKPGINTLNELFKACSEEDYDLLLRVYCNRNSEPAQKSVATYKADGSLYQTSCESCKPVVCP